MTDRFRRICVFCGSSTGARPAYAEAARGLGRLLAQRGIGLVYGGSHLGLMGILADAAVAAGGTVTGVIPQMLVRKEVAHRELADLRVVNTMHERKALMAELADGFIAMPGGFGTLEEFCEVLTWGQLGVHRKPCGLLNVEGFFDPLLAMFDRAVAELLLKPANRDLVLTGPDAETLLGRMARFQPLEVDKWVDRTVT